MNVSVRNAIKLIVMAKLIRKWRKVGSAEYLLSDCHKDEQQKGNRSGLRTGAVL